MGMIIIFVDAVVKVAAAAVMTYNKKQYLSAIHWYRPRGHLRIEDVNLLILSKLWG